MRDSTEPLGALVGSATDKGLVNSVVLLDLRKAFDLVNHTIVLDNLAIEICVLYCVYERHAREHMNNKQCGHVC